MPRRGPQKEYSFDGCAGCVERFTSRATGTLVGIYASDQAGMESDPEHPWSTVCEVHHTIVCHAAFVLAQRSRDPSMWCEECRDALDAKKESAMRVIGPLRMGSVEHWQWEAKRRYAIARDLRIEEALGTPREFISATEAQMIAWLHGLVARGLLFGKNWDEIRRAVDNAYFFNVSEW